MTDWDNARANMVESQIRPNAVTDQRLINAMLSVPRERFTPPDKRSLAYCDGEIAVSESAEGAPPRHLIPPMPFARIVQLAEIADSDHVLDIGCASGYSSAVIASFAGSVVALEEDEDLAAHAQDLLGEIGIDNVAVVNGRMNEGYPSQGPYDVIILEGAVDEVPAALFDQLAQGGRLVAATPGHGVGRVHLFVKTDGSIGGAPAFDAQLSPLAGFQREPGFSL